MSSASDEVPFYLLHRVKKKAFANWMTSKVMKLHPTVLMSYCVFTEAARIGPKMLQCLDVFQVEGMFVSLVFFFLFLIQPLVCPVPVTKSSFQ